MGDPEEGQWQLYAGAGIKIKVGRAGDEEASQKHPCMCLHASLQTFTLICTIEDVCT